MNTLDKSDAKKFDLHLNVMIFANDKTYVDINSSIYINKSRLLLQYIM